MSFRVHVNSIFSDSIGYGQGGIGLVRELMRRGFEVSVEPSFVLPPVPRDVAMLFTVQPNPPFDLYISHAPPMQMGVPGEYKDSIYKSVAWTMWEWSKFPDEDHRELKARIDMFDEIVVFNDDSKAAFETLETGKEFKVLQGGHETEFWSDAPDERDWYSEPFIVGMAGILSNRKDPFVVMRAVQRLADEGLPIEFWAKGRGGEIPKTAEERYPSMKVFTGHWTPEAMRKYFSSLHVYAAASWGEGLNMPAIEAAATGAAVVASDCDGHKRWVEPAGGLLLPTVPGRFMDDLWHLRVVEDELVNILRRLATNRSETRLIGESMRRQIPSVVSWERAMDRLLKMVE